MNIISATYGGVDCTQEIQDKVIGDNIFLYVDNNIVGDPSMGAVKYLSLEWEYGGERHTKKVREHEWLVIKNTTSDRLGIFYSNNYQPETQPAIKKSLETLVTASKDKADILTSVWYKQEGNPFTEFQSLTRTYGHINQVLNILQLLYNAEKIGGYNYVSFLEHDVMYGEGYFDFEDFNEGQVLTNMNYIGLNKSGWQVKKQNDEPMHQMTMRFSDAITHFEKVLKNAILIGAGLVEPQDLERIQWEAPNPSVHINHGHHYTSHNSIYSTQTTEVDDYWGEYTQYTNLFI